MARVFNSESGEFEHVPTLTLRKGVGGRVSKYPWHRWLDGRVWQLKMGEDFECKLGTFRSLVVNQGAKQMWEIWTKKVDEKTLLIQRTDDKEE